MSGLIVLDCDVDETRGLNGIETLEKLKLELGPLPATLTQKTPRTGRHSIFSSRGICSPRGKIGNDIDVKYRGYVMISPSSIDGKRYEIVDGVDENGNFIIAELPKPWIEYLEKSPSYQSNSTSKEAKPSKIYTEIDTDRMFNNCKFLSHCSIEENASCLPEPMWHSMIQVLSCIEDSDSLIHTLSEPYHSYSYKETQKKIDNARKFGQPHSCDYISANFPEICKNCPSAINERLV
ncbi:MAG: bifunctional DNA primase/polymerase [Lachnospiraceae bacterium]|nr:bifunctional DNA primase/polymerase [Lachnospiraceae bacterium]